MKESSIYTIECCHRRSLLAMQISSSEKQLLIKAVAELKQEHRELDIAIEQMAEKVHSNQLEISRLKKHKLKLKDAIARIESKLIPDLHA